MGIFHSRAGITFSLLQKVYYACPKNREEKGNRVTTPDSKVRIGIKQIEKEMK